MKVIPLDPSVFEQDANPAKNVAKPRVVPPAILAAIQAAPLTADLFAVDQFPVFFDSPILKVNTLTFQPGGRLFFRRGYEHPWIVVVARTIRFAGPNEGGEIGVEVFHGAGVEPEHPVLPQAVNGIDEGSADGRNGTDGAHGINGLNGLNASDGDPSPELYIVAGLVLTQDGEAPPTAARLVVWHQGTYGNYGGRGQDGQSGGNGGKGKRGRWDGVKCTKKAGSGGNGGNAGGGGNGGRGGQGGTGGTVQFAGSAQALGVLEFSKVNNFGGPGGETAGMAKNGLPGAGGARGSRPGKCTGGSDGAPGNPYPTSPVNPPEGARGLRGLIGTTVLNVAALF